MRFRGRTLTSLALVPESGGWVGVQNGELSLQRVG